MTNGYAPGDYTVRCHKCGKHKIGMDKRAITCKECADTMKTMIETMVRKATADLAHAEKMMDALRLYCGGKLPKEEK